jgi:hypothetical protein
MPNSRAAFDRVRLERVESSAQRIEHNLREWLARRRKRDSPKFRVRLDALSATLSAALAAVAPGGNIGVGNSSSVALH